MTRLRIAACIAGGIAVFGAAFGLGFAQTHSQSKAAQNVSVGSPPASGSPLASGTAAPTITTTVPCSLTAGTGSAGSVPVYDVCSSSGAPHFDSPEQAMTYLASAWNSGDVRGIDYVTDPAGRQQMDAMAAQMVDLHFKSCSRNPGGDYTCYFSHNITPSTSPTTYPNPGGYPPGEAVFTVAPAQGPGWYLTFVIHCG